MYLYSLIFSLLSYSFTQIQAQSVVWIVDVPEGFNDHLDTTGAHPIKQLRHETEHFINIPDERNYYAALTGKLPLGESLYPALDQPYLHSVIYDAGINVATAHFGRWDFSVHDKFNTFHKTDRPIEIVRNFTRFAREHENFVATVFMPPLSDNYVPTNSQLRQGRYAGRVRCYNGELAYYSNCSRYPWVKLQGFKNGYVSTIIAAANKANALVFWSPVHGPFDPREESLSRPRNPFRGMARSLYRGGTDTRLRYNRRVKLSWPQVVYSFDLPPTILSLYNLEIPGADGVNLFASQTYVPRNLLFALTDYTTPGNCWHSSPKYMYIEEIGGVFYRIVYDSDPLNDQIYSLHGTNIAQARVDFTVENRQDDRISVCDQPHASRVINKPDARTSKPNKILLLTSDDHGFADVGYAYVGYQDAKRIGGNYPRTPNIDAIAKRGVIFNDGQAASAVCSPSRIALDTGITPSSLGLRRVFDHVPNGRIGRVSPTNPGIEYGTIASDLQQQGYYTYFVGKWHRSETRRRDITPARYGYDDWDVQSGVPGELSKLLNIRSIDYLRQSSAEIIKRWRKQWDAHCSQSEDKCFANIAFQDPHGPHHTVSGECAQYGFTESTEPHYDGKTSRIFKQQSPESKYFCIIARMDYAIGEVRAWIKEHGFDKQTLVIFSADNPAESMGLLNTAAGLHGNRGSKRSTYGSTKVPFVIDWGGSLNGVVDTTVSQLDLRPTIMDLVSAKENINSYSKLQGVSLKDGLFNNQWQEVSRAVRLHEVVWPQRDDCARKSPRFSVEWQRYSYHADHNGIRQISERGLFNQELYDMENDPMQTKNLIANLPKVAAQARMHLLQWQDFDTKHGPAGNSKSSFALARYQQHFVCPQRKARRRRGRQLQAAAYIG